MIDWDRLNALKADIGEEDFADVAFLFVAEMTECIDKLLSAPDAATASDFHFLRGSAANLGFTALATACLVAEQACASGTPPDIDGLAATYAASLEESMDKMPELGQAA
jgi:HPt (histidine-containing phosphotransfer) domain-containing protein